MRLRATCVTVLPLLLNACSGSAPEPTGETQSPIVRGQDEAGLDQVVLIQAQRTNGTTRCSGTYIAPRVILTAAHCIKANTIKNRVFVYYGDDYNTDVAMLPNIPAPGSESPWARVETWKIHPDYVAANNYPDLAVLFLDRELPFRPMPLFIEHVGQRYVGDQATIAGWGASESLDPNLTQVVGVGVKRSGHVTLMGSPTAADYHPEDPNPGILDPNIDKNLIKTDGHAPSANPCAGDSGGPLIIRKFGQNFLAGVGFWTGLSCEDYSIFSRIDPFMKFLSDSIRDAGFRAVTPKVECVGANQDGSLTAYFGYQNDNGLTVNIPFGFDNMFLPFKAGAQRPTSFSPGAQDWTFGADFQAGQKLIYDLRAPFGRRTVLRVDQNSPRCADSDPGYQCASNCRAIMNAPCTPAFYPTFQACMNDCATNSGFFAGCETEWGAYLLCVGKQSADPANWICDPDLGPQPPQCDDALNAAFVCEGF